MSSPVVAIGALKGGANDRSSFAKWLDENVFHGATYAGLKWKNAPSIWISASDIYHRVPFHFSAETFAALCSNLDDIRVADAVAASAAVPVVFKPINISTHSGRCAPKNPEWLQNALDDPDASIRLKAYGRALQSYRSADVNYIKLLDGALTDNLGVTPLALARASSLTPYGPLSEKETVRLKTLIYVVADAGRETEYPWVRKLDGPAITEILGAVTDTTISSSVREGFDALNLALSQWRNDLIDYRCKLPAATVKNIAERSRAGTAARLISMCNAFRFMIFPSRCSRSSMMFRRGFHCPRLRSISLFAQVIWHSIAIPVSSKPFAGSSLMPA